jgi:hypothetical protein
METLAVRYARLREEMDELYDGGALAAAAETVLAELPSGPLTLISSSDQGAGLAAVCASRRDAETVWRKVNLVGERPVRTDGRVIIIEPLDPGAGWGRAVERLYPGARVLFVSALRQERVVVAA